MKPLRLAASALIFDFDGTIIDTETAVYESWRAAYVAAGVEPIAFEAWLDEIGQSDGQGLDVRAILCQHLDVGEMPAEIDKHRREVRDEILLAEPIRSGVIDWITAANDADVPLAIASSSSSDWVRDNLERTRLDTYFPVVSCADPGIPGKPDPTVYLSACRELDADPASAIAIEDSTHGVSAAISAGMSCLAAPGPMTRTMDFDHATIRVDSLADLAPSDWL